MKTDTSTLAPLVQRPAWKALQAHAQEIQQTNLRALFAADSARGDKFVAEAEGLFLDYSKNRITDETLKLLIQLAEESGLQAKVEAMFRGDKINITENRAVLHVALRAPKGEKIFVDGEDVVPGVHAVLDRMSAFAERVRSGAWKGHTGKRIRNLINIGIGGSDLGPVMAYEALKHYSQRDLTFKFVSNVDGTDFAEAVEGLNADETLFLVASKTFTTLETMTNAHTARDWALAGLGGDEKAVAKHFVAISTNAKEVAKFGIDTENMFGFWDWVGGRYSMDSAIGLSTMIAIGPDNFRSMLAGFHAIDEHFRTTPLEKNLPALLGLLTVWYTDFFDAQTVAILPYEQYLKRFPAYLQQLTMESNGKHVTLDGTHVNYENRAGVLGRAGNQWAALVLSADSPGDAADSVRFHWLLQDAECVGAAPRHADGERLCAGGSAGVRQDGGAGEGRGHAGLARAASRLRGQSTVEYDTGRGTDTGTAGQAGRSV